MNKLSELNWKELVVYDPSSPSFLRWKVTFGKRGGTKHKNDPVGNQDVEGYYRVMVFGKAYKVHRIIYHIFNDDLSDDYFVDHIDGDVTNNYKENLRKGIEINSRNKKMSNKNTSGIVGVTFRDTKSGGCWSASWFELDGYRNYRSFAVSVYGSNAFNKAVQVREDAIKELNSKGAGYTERHGKVNQ